MGEEVLMSAKEVEVRFLVPANDAEEIREALAKEDSVLDPDNEPFEVPPDDRESYRIPPSNL